MSETLLAIKQIEKKDLNLARIFAEKGMHLSWYVENRLELYLYGWDVVYEALVDSTLTIAAYDGDRMVGYLFARFDGEQPVLSSLWRRTYHRVFTRISKLFSASKAADPYDVANKEMLGRLHPKPEGAIMLFATDPDFKGQGVGTVLLNELARLRQGKSVYLYTDNGCTYQFYERRGFERVGCKDVALPTGAGGRELTCMLFTKTL